MNVINEYKNTLRSSAKKAAELHKELTVINQKINSGNFTEQYIRDSLKPKYDRKIAEINAVCNSMIHSIEDQMNAYRTELNSETQLKAEDITDDIKLLETGLLNEKDIAALLSANRNNYTMSELICRYADKNGIKHAVTLHKAEAEHNKQTADGLQELSRRIGRYYTNPDIVQITEKFIEGLPDE